MRYNSNREVNEQEHRDNGERNIITSSQLVQFLGNDYLNEAEEMLLDILNDQYDVQDARKEILSYDKE